MFIYQLVNYKKLLYTGLHDFTLTLHFMPPKRLRTDLYGNVQPDLFTKAKSKPKPWIEPEWLKYYRRDRDRVIWKLFPGSREEIENKYKEV